MHHIRLLCKDSNDKERAFTSAALSCIKKWHCEAGNTSASNSASSMSSFEGARTSSACAEPSCPLVFSPTYPGDCSSEAVPNDDADAAECADADVTMVARRGGEVYSNLCLFEPETTDDVEASRRSKASLRPNRGRKELEMRDEEEVRNLHGLDMVVSVELCHLSSCSRSSERARRSLLYLDNRIANHNQTKLACHINTRNRLNAVKVLRRSNDNMLIVI